MIAANQSCARGAPSMVQCAPVLSGAMRTVSHHEVAARMKAVLPRV